MRSWAIRSSWVCIDEDEVIRCWMKSGLKMTLWCNSPLCEGLSGARRMQRNMEYMERVLGKPCRNFQEIL